MLVHPPEACQLRAQPLKKYSLTFNLALEREFCSGLDADGQTWLAYRA
jgi:hypothetical protein